MRLYKVRNRTVYSKYIMVRYNYITIIAYILISEDVPNARNINSMNLNSRIIIYSARPKCRL